jgi:hypothetical protein
LTTRETVFKLTPALLATSRIVGLPTLSSLLLLDPVTAALTTLSWCGRRHLSLGMTTMSRGAFARGYPAVCRVGSVAPRGANSITEGK